MMLGITHRSNRDPITAVMVTSDTLDLFQNFAESSGAARVGDRIQKNGRKQYSYAAARCINFAGHASQVNHVNKFH